MDERDPHCVHVLAYRDGAAVGTGRVDLAAAASRGAKIGRVAVLSPARRARVGTAIMDALHRIAADHGAVIAWCHAQTAAVHFYSTLGYRVTGEPFVEAGIPHVRMERPLQPARSGRT